jgi:hypothetical protein
MLANQKLNQSFKDAVEEVAIECELVKEISPNSAHTCRTCAPNNRSLYTRGRPFNVDEIRDSACIKATKKEVQLSVVTVDGDKYYWAPSVNNVYGYIVYTNVLGVYEKVVVGSPLFMSVVSAIRA